MSVLVWAESGYTLEGDMSSVWELTGQIHLTLRVQQQDGPKQLESACDKCEWMGELINIDGWVDGG